MTNQEIIDKYLREFNQVQRMKVPIELNPYLHRMINQALHIQNVVHWVAVKDRLPEDGGYYICCLENGAVTECQYEIIQNKWWLGLEREVRQHNKVVYWMQKPEPPCA